VRANPKIAGTTHNVFGIQTGVAVMFLVRKPKPADNPQPCKIFYVTLQDEQRKEQKLDWFAHQRDFDQIDFTRIRPDKNHNWINLQTDEIQAEWEALIPVADKGVKSGKGGNAIFEIYANGVVTARDEWVYALQADQLQPKIEFLLSVYRKQVESGKFDANDLDYRIKWSESLKAHLKRGKIIIFDIEKIHHDIYRPFIALWYYFDTNLSDRLTSLHKLFFGEKGQIDANRVIMFSGTSSSKPFQTLATNSIWSVDTLEKTQGLALYRYTPTGERIDNITDWALERFRTRYGGGGDHTSEVFKTSEVSITKRDIFHYVYAVLHDPAYREKYRLNLKRDFPRIPFYDDFWQWAAWGKQLMDLHVGFETVEPWPLERREKPVGDHTSEVFKTSEVSKPTTVKLRADKEAGLILIDDQTTLAGVPPQAWDYQLGNRSALDWILDQYKETKIKDPTIAQKTAEGVFKAYRFADHKETVIDLLCRVCRVSVETMRIVGEMK
jgi:predicted helicase